MLVMTFLNDGIGDGDAYGKAATVETGQDVAQVGSSAADTGPRQEDPA